MEDFTDEEDQLAAEEAGLRKKIRFCEDCLGAVFKIIGSYSMSGKEKIIGEEIVTFIHSIEQNLRIEILHLQLGRVFHEGQNKAPEPL